MFDQCLNVLQRIHTLTVKSFDSSVRLNCVDHGLILSRQPVKTQRGAGLTRSGRDAERLVESREIVVHEVSAHRDVIVKCLREGVR